MIQLARLAVHDGAAAADREALLGSGLLAKQEFNGSRLTVGGGSIAWQDAAYSYQQPSAQQPFNRES
jgi:hypothetical protein